MAYEKQTWIDNETPLDAAHFNHMEGGIETAQTTAENALSIANKLPAVTTSDAGKFLRVSSEGVWAAETIPNAEEASF